MKAISLFYSIDTDTMYHHAPGLPPRGNPPRAQGIMGARRMPWHRKSTKGAASRDRPGGGANGRRSRDSRMGEPSRRHGRLPHGRPSLAGTTGGTETSKYPEEEKSTEIARVAASESARAQTGYGVAGRRARGPQAPAAVRKPRSSGTAWEGRPQRVRAPYAKDEDCGLRSRVGPGT